MFPLSGVRFVFGEVPANLKCKEDVNQDRDVLKGCCVSAHIYRGSAVVVWY